MTMKHVWISNAGAPLSNRFGTVAAWAVAMALVWGCGDESSSDASSAPEVDTAALVFTCVPVTEDDEERFDGRVLDNLAVPVSDVDFDLASVTAVVGGSPIMLSWASSSGEVLDQSVEAINVQLEQGTLESTLHVFNRSAETTPLRCDTGTSIVIRATDKAGNVTIEESMLP
ncbi:MAG: hypothetical protein AAFX99_12380 [Myxococcota bacterium]